MKIEVYYMDGRFEIYDTEAHFNATSALGGGGNCMTTYAIKGAGGDGLWLSYSFYDVSESLSVAGHDAQCATLQRAVDVQVLDGDDLARVAWVSIDGVKRFFRLHEGEPLIDGFKFETSNEIYVGSRDVAAIEDKAFDLYMVLHGEASRPGAMPREDGEDEDSYNARIAKLIGWPADLLMRAVQTVRERDEWVEEDGVEDDPAEAAAIAYEGAPAHDPDGVPVVDLASEAAEEPSTAEKPTPDAPAVPLWAAASAAQPQPDAAADEPDFADDDEPMPEFDDDDMPEFID